MFGSFARLDVREATDLTGVNMRWLAVVLLSVFLQLAGGQAVPSPAPYSALVRDGLVAQLADRVTQQWPGLERDIR
jgi:hypothetical protein